MRILTAAVVLSTLAFLSGCASLQSYPSFGTVGGGRLVTYDRRGAHNVLPPPGGMTTQPARDAHPIR
jgi:hypothetical protein